MRTRLATSLRRLADRLAPAPAGDCGSGTTHITYSAPAGTSSMRVGPITQTQVFPSIEFEQGEGWSPA
jgi:hypothetical protein